MHPAQVCRATDRNRWVYRGLRTSLKRSNMRTCARCAVDFACESTYMCKHTCTRILIYIYIYIYIYVCMRPISNDPVDCNNIMYRGILNVFAYLWRSSGESKLRTRARASTCRKYVRYLVGLVL
jgi:hypothetical protein